MQGIKVIATGSAIPKKVMTNDDFAKTLDTSDEWIRERTGIRERHLCEDETCESLATEAAKKAIEKAASVDENFSKDEIGVILVATSSSENQFPSMACMVQKNLEFANDVMSFDIQAACSGFVYGMDISRGLLLGGKKKYALLVGAERLSLFQDYTDRSTCILFGDGAGAAVLELADEEDVYAHCAWSKGDDKTLYCAGINKPDQKMKMDGQGTFKFAVTALPQGIREALKKAELTMEDIDHVVCHQANERIIRNVMKKYKGQEDKFYINIDHFANTSAASIPIAIDEMYEKGMVKSGEKFLCVGFGGGLTWASVIFTVA